MNQGLVSESSPSINMWNGVAGLLADARQIVKIARDEAADYRAIYGSPIPLKYLTERVSGYIHMYTLYSCLQTVWQQCHA
eukprot:UN10255